MSSVLVIIHSGQRWRPCSLPGQFDHPSGPCSSLPWTHHGPVVPAGEVWFSQPHLSQNCASGWYFTDGLGHICWAVFGNPTSNQRTALAQGKLSSSPCLSITRQARQSRDIKFKLTFCGSVIHGHPILSDITHREYRIYSYSLVHVHTNVCHYT